MAYDADEVFGKLQFSIYFFIHKIQIREIEMLTVYIIFLYDRVLSCNLDCPSSFLGEQLWIDSAWCYMENRINSKSSEGRPYYYTMMLKSNMQLFCISLYLTKYHDK